MPPFWGDETNFYVWMNEWLNERGVAFWSSAVQLQQSIKIQHHTEQARVGCVLTPSDLLKGWNGIELRLLNPPSCLHIHTCMSKGETHPCSEHCLQPTLPTFTPLHFTAAQSVWASACVSRHEEFSLILTVIMATDKSNSGLIHLIKIWSCWGINWYAGCWPPYCLVTLFFFLLQCCCKDLFELFSVMFFVFF